MVFAAQRSQSRQDSQLAITGMEIILPGCDGLPTFEHLVYTGSQPVIGERESPWENSSDLVARAAREAWLDAGAPVDATLLAGGLDDGSSFYAGFWKRAVEIEGSAGDAPGSGTLLPAAVEQARALLEKRQAGAVVLGIAEAGGAAALVLRRLDDAQEAGDRIYAVICGVSHAPSVQHDLDTFVRQISLTVLERASIQPGEVGLLEICSTESGQLEPPGFAGLSRAFRTGEAGLTCAIESLPFPRAGSAQTYGIANLVKVAVCLYRRMIPAQPGWDGPQTPALWEATPFYVPAEPRAWFLDPVARCRTAVIFYMGVDGSTGELLLNESDTPRNFHSTGLSRFPFYLFPVAGQDKDSLVGQLEALKRLLEGEQDLKAAARRNFQLFQLDSEQPYAACLLGHDLPELKREVEYAIKGVAGAFDRQAEWQTPLGSYFTSRPTGQAGKIAFVYPGAFNSYVGLGRDLLYLFPQLFDRVSSVVTDVGFAIREKQLYPRSQNRLTKAEVEAIEASLGADGQAMLTSGISLAVIYTLILREVFGVHPDFAFGYSLGETSLLIAMGIWGNSDHASAALEASQLFTNRLAGPQNAVREYWGLAPIEGENTGSPFWGNYVLMASADAVQPLVDREPHVYLTHINTPRQVVIGGDPEGCQRVIAALHCNHLKAPFDFALHCDAMRSEYEALVRLHDWPVQARPDVALFSAADCQELEIEQSAIAATLARTLTTCVDFPRLVQAVYDRGARLFIELGAGSNCARWVDDTLSASPHAAIAINRKGMDDQACILRLVARLSSLRVPLDLSPLYS